MERFFIICISVLILSGCAQWTTKEDTITWPDGEIMHIQVAGDGVVMAKRGDMEITADHRGRPSIPEQVLGVGVAAVSNGVQVELDR